MRPVIAFHLLTAIFFSYAIDCAGQNVMEKDSKQALQYGVYELSFHTSEKGKDPFYELDLKLVFTLPGGSSVTVDGFNDGGSLFKARAYCKETGIWTWESESNDPAMDGLSGSFEVLSSKLKGKLTVHPRDPYQFAYHNGDWFLHIGDTGYRFVVASEPFWKEYIDQASEMGATKIRTWFAMERSAVSDLFEGDGKTIALNYWREIERRIIYTLENHPHIVLQLIPYAEDADLINSYASGNPAAQKVAQYAQARWSSFPNIQWTMSNDMVIVNEDSLSGREVHFETINLMGRDMAAREPWGTLLTNHQSRFKGYDFVQEPWSDFVTLEDLDQVAGLKILEYREKIRQPIVNDEDRYELYRPAAHRRYFFRRLMWASLLSGGHATYGGLRTYEAYGGHNIGPRGQMSNDYIPFEGMEKGVSGYFDANKRGILSQGAHDFRHIHQFFSTAGIDLAGMQPDDALAGNEPFKYKVIRDKENIIIYLANPSGENPGTDFPAGNVPEVEFLLENGTYQILWFDPDSGTWVRTGGITGGQQKFVAPSIEDWVLLIRKVD
ncbi:DUF5060 domain-containing protein [Cyclobacterium plantarum]|uniref:DUF5060 domain-containing protein n=1 Tax=Cyclobacterium plantarum TaxID=2716263 RepID=UPI003F72324B